MRERTNLLLEYSEGNAVTATSIVVILICPSIMDNVGLWGPAKVQVIAASFVHQSSRQRIIVNRGAEAKAEVQSCRN